MNGQPCHPDRISVLRALQIIENSENRSHTSKSESVIARGNKAHNFVESLDFFYDILRNHLCCVLNFH